MALALQVIKSGALYLDLNAGAYSIMEGSLRGTGEAAIDATYGASVARHGAPLTNRTYQNRTISLNLKITKTSSTAVDDRMAARNKVSNALELARQYHLRTKQGTTVWDGEMVLKYCYADSTVPVYARIIDGHLDDSDVEHANQASLKGTTSKDYNIPLTLIVEPFWRLERDVYLYNALLNGGFEAGYTGTQPWGWSAIADSSGAIAGTPVQSASFVRSGTYSHKLSMTSTGAGTTGHSQTITLAAVGWAVGNQIEYSAYVYISSLTGTANAEISLVYFDVTPAQIGASLTATTVTTGSWQRLSVVGDIPTGCLTINCYITIRSAANADAAVVFWDEAMATKHEYTMLLNGGFEVDTDSNGTCDGWTVSTTTMGAAYTQNSTTSKYGTYNQQVACSAAAGTTILYQDVTLQNFNLHSGDVLSGAVWCAAPVLAAGTTAYLSLALFDAAGLTITSSESTTISAASGTYLYRSASATIPIGAVTARYHLRIDSASGGSSTIRWDWATLYLGYHDGQYGRVWPHSRTDPDTSRTVGEWVDSGLLMTDPTVVTGKQITMAHTGFRGNVPAPCQIIAGNSLETPTPFFFGYKRGDTRWTGYYKTSTAASTISAQIAGGSTSTAWFGSTSRRWSPASSTETALWRWSMTDIPAGRYQTMVRAKQNSSIAANQFKFRVAAKVYQGTGNAGTWTDLKANLWDSSAYAWPVGVLEMPPISRLPSWINSFNMDLWGRVLSTAGGSSCWIDVDGIWLLPVDGYYQSKIGPNASTASTNTTLAFAHTLIDSITPLPGGMYTYPSSANANKMVLPTILTDIPVAQETPIYLSDTGKFIVVAVGSSPTMFVNLGLYYRPLFTNPGVAT